METKLKKIRQRSGLTQAKAAEACGVSLGVWRHYEQGNRKFDGAGLRTIIRAALVLMANLDELIEDPETVESIREYLDRGEL